MAKSEKVRDFRQAITPASETRRHVFGGFRKCCYPLQKFDSDPERRLAVMIDADTSVEKWIKPGRAQFQIEYRSGDSYEPDFVVETKDRAVIIEVKARNELEDIDVQAKAAAATKWCRTANTHAKTGIRKSWSYALVPDDQITGAATLNGILARFGR